MSYEKIDENSINKAFVETINLLYINFKKRFNLIKSYDFQIVLSCLNKEKINEKSNEMLKKYFMYDKSKALDKVNEYFKTINEKIKEPEKMFKSLPKKQNKNNNL